MSSAHSRPSAVRTLLLFCVFATLLISVGQATAQSRRKQQDPPPLPEPLPTISTLDAKCSNPYHDALDRLRGEQIKQLTGFENQARATEPDVTGRWLFWVKAARGSSRPPTSEQVCVEQTTKGGRQRCLRWETKLLDPALVGVAPTAEELGVLRALDGYVADKGAPLEFGSNGRQFVILQRFANDIDNYSMQPPHPALCNGVQEMMDFHAEKLAGVEKRATDVASTAARALALARKRVAAAREQRVAEARTAAAAVAAASAAGPPPDPLPKPSEVAAVASPVKVVPDLGPIPDDARPAALVTLALEGLLAPDQLKVLEAEPQPLRRLQRAREMVSAEPMSAASTAVRGGTGAALRMVEAAAYGEVQVARVGRMKDLFLGTIEKIRGAHRANCTCAN